MSRGPLLWLHPTDRSDPAKEGAENIADTLSSLKVDRGGLDVADPRSGGKWTIRLIVVVRL